jgi:phospholipid/cholesterol/gamma-HCH transport system substrate-binding protein
METRSNQVLVGSITLGLLAALVVFVVWLSQVGGGGDKRYDIFFTQGVEGLAKGSSVTFSGVPVGQIESINLVPDSPQFIRVRVNVNGDTPVLEGSTATIRGVGFTGVSQIQIDPPPAPQPGQRPPPHREIRCPEQNAQSECPYGVPVLPVRPGAIASLLNTAPELLERVSTLTERLTELLSDRNQESIAGILDNLEQVSRSLAERGPEIAATMAEARTAIRQGGEAADRIGQLVRDLRATSEALRSITEKVDEQGAGSIIGGQKLPDYEPRP